MSENYLRLIPRDPGFVPDEQARVGGLAYFSALLPGAAEVSEVLTAHVEFIDQGGNFEYVACLVCHAVIEDSWWTQAMDRAYDRELGFVQLLVETPCCARKVSLNDLEYHWPAGFARYRLEARDPNGEFSDEHKAALEGILHCPLRMIWAHY